LAGLWVAAMGLLWVGGDIRFCIAGGVLGTGGHWFSYKMRNQPSRLRPFIISALVIALSIFLRNDMVKTFNGDWVPIGQYLILPIGQYLILVSGLAAYDVRTRGGLYTGLVLSGMVLFFASQQAFEYSFAVFVVGFLVVLLAFMVMSFLEDMIKAARVYWAKNRPETLVYWIVATCAMFVLAGLAFWVLPRGENNLIGQPQLAVLPYSQSDIELQQSPQRFDRGNGPQADLSPEGSSGQLGGAQADSGVKPRLLDIREALSGTDGLQGNGPDKGTTPQTSMVTGERGLGSDTGNGPGSAGETGTGVERFGDQRPNHADSAAPVYTADSGVGPLANASGPGSVGQTQPAVRDNRSENLEDPLVFHVRSNVASYWRGIVLEDYDGTQWFVSDLNNKMIESPNHTGTWYNRENDFSNANVNYRQTFFLRGNDDLPMVTGYRALQVVVNEEQTDNALLASGASYRVISSVPRHNPDQLRHDTSVGLSPELTILPQSLEQQLSELAQKVVAGASSDFEKLGLIISYLNTETRYAPAGSSGVVSLATLDEFLFQGIGGSSLDYATATVMLARASGMPARLAAGYLPGTRDPLTGTYRVLESDRHAWTEVQFDDSGWVPFDGGPRSDVSFGQRPAAGLANLFMTGAGDELYATLKEGPQEAFRTLVTSVPGPVLWALAPAIAIVLLIGRWFQSNSRRRLIGQGWRLLAYDGIPGEGRREMKKLYNEVERLIRRYVGTPRAGWQTADHYASIASDRSPEIDNHLSWFTQAVWRAAYRSGDLHAGLVAEGRRRLALLKEAFKASGNQQAKLQS